MENDTLPVDQQPTLRVVPMPADTNAAGNIFGGWLMSQVDIAGSIVAIRRAQGAVTTVAVNSFQFHRPVYVGDIVSLYSSLERVGNTSLTIAVTVYAERLHRHGAWEPRCVKVASATLTYVAIDEHHEKRPVPPES